MTVQDLVEPGQHRGGRILADAQRPQRVPHESGDDGGLVALAADVPEGDDPVVDPDGEHVVEVAADLTAVAGGMVGGRQVAAPGSRAASEG